MREPIGVLLAGGRGSRLGGAKAFAPLGGRPLICHALAALRDTVAEVAIVAKPDTSLSVLHGVTVWREPAEPVIRWSESCMRWRARTAARCWSSAT